MLADLTFNLSDKQNRILLDMFATTISSLSDLDDQLLVVALNPDSSLCQLNSKPNPIILIFGGQTARSVGLNKHVYDTSAFLPKYPGECDEVIKSVGYQGIYPDIFETKPSDDVVSLQTIQLALQYACARSWIACGLKVDCAAFFWSAGCLDCGWHFFARRRVQAGARTSCHDTRQIGP